MLIKNKRFLSLFLILMMLIAAFAVTMPSIASRDDSEILLLVRRMNIVSVLVL
jgi:hypothetical protein